MNKTLRGDEVSMWGGSVGLSAMSRRCCEERLGKVRRLEMVLCSIEKVERSGRRDSGGSVEVVDGRVKY